VCSLSSTRREDEPQLTAPVVIAAHGSWEPGRLPLQPAREPTRASDLLAFKAHFQGAALPAARMPLVAFPGGYGGLVHSDAGRVSFSCCIRRDRLAACRSDAPGASAGAAVLAHVLGSCRGMREALDGGVREGQWLAAGPLRPGIRHSCSEGYFAVGNALGEAHPIVAEGISMAIQSAWLLCERLIGAPRAATKACWNEIGRDYEASYRGNFAMRIRAASVFARFAMHPRAADVATGMLASAPALLGLGARFAGKAKALRAIA
jgi:flavin-dependent dehydrogenase